jgi:hypothetical protein
MMQVSWVPGKPCAHCFGHFTKCPERGRWNMFHCRSRISTRIYGTLRTFTALLRFIFAAKNEVPFFQVRIAVPQK